MASPDATKAAQDGDKPWSYVEQASSLDEAWRRIQTLDLDELRNALAFDVVSSRQRTSEADDSRLTSWLHG